MRYSEFKNDNDKYFLHATSEKNIPSIEKTE